MLVLRVTFWSLIMYTFFFSVIARTVEAWSLASFIRCEVLIRNFWSILKTTIIEKCSIIFGKRTKSLNYSVHPENNHKNNRNAAVLDSSVPLSMKSFNADISAQKWRTASASVPSSDGRISDSTNMEAETVGRRRRS